MSKVVAISAIRLSESLGVNRKNLLSLARKYFSKSQLKEIEILRKSHGGQLQKDILLTKEQAEFLVCRSRGDVQKATSEFNLDLTHRQSIMRNEVFFMNLVDSILTVTKFNLHRQYYCEGFNVDGFILGDTGAIIIEYDEQQHKSSKTDSERMQKILESFKKDDFDVFVIRVNDDVESIQSGIKQISEIIHSDCIGCVEYVNHDKNYY